MTQNCDQIKDQGQYDLESKCRALEVVASSQVARLERDLDVDHCKQAAYFIALASGPDIKEHYKFIPNAAKIIVEDSECKSGNGTRRIFLQLVIFYSMLATIKKRLINPLPQTLAWNQIAHFERMLSDNSVLNEWLDIDQDLFQKEFGLAVERLFASGSQLLDKNCGIPKSIVIKGGVNKSPSNLLFFASLAGFQPFIQIHTHTFNLKKFNEAGWDECYRGCAELCQLFPELLGVFGSSWFYDPIINEISPRLKYLQHVPLTGGARFLYYSTGGAAVGNATSTSESRKKLYQEGKYVPKNYMMIWGKKSLMAWVDGLHE